METIKDVIVVSVVVAIMLFGMFLVAGFLGKIINI